jgi:hypothetical protein
MILPVFAFIQKKKRKSTLKAWGFRNPKGEGIDIVISLLGTFIIFCLSRYIYRGSWFPFSDSFNILSFLALIPLCIILEDWCRLKPWIDWEDREESSLPHLSLRCSTSLN